MYLWNNISTFQPSVLLPIMLTEYNNCTVRANFNGYQQPKLFTWPYQLLCVRICANISM